MPSRVSREVRAAEPRLPALAAALDLPLSRLAGEPEVVALGLGLRGWGLYRGFRHSLKGPTLLTGHVVLRALLDTGILTRWIEDDPKLRVQLWFAEDQRDRLNARTLVLEHFRRRGRPAPEPAPDWDEAAIEREIDEARTAAHAAGIRIPRTGRRCLPTIEEMVKAVPDLWEVYYVAYRHLSPVQHAGGRSFVKDAVEERSSGTYMKPGAPFSEADLRALGVSAVCGVLATVSRQLRLGIEAECDAIRLSVVFPEASDAI